MEDWTQRQEPKETLNVWEQGLLISGIKEQEDKERIMKAQIHVCLKEYEKDIRKQICDEIRANAISHNNLEVDMYYITPQQLYEIERGVDNESNND